MKKLSSQDREFIRNYDSSVYEKLSVAVDMLVFTIKDDRLRVLTVEREEPPFTGKPALPGVFVGIDESLDDAVCRGLLNKTGLKEIYFEQLYTWGDVDRDPRMRILSVSYLALVPIERLEGSAGTQLDLRPVDKILGGKTALAFDHKKIIAFGRERVKNKAEYMPIAFQFLPETFTLPQLQRVYEILLDKKLYKTNFRNKVISLVTETGEYTSGDAHRPSRLYKRR